MARVVVFIDGHASLYLGGVRRDSNGRIAAGDVHNGAWYLEVSGDTWYAKRSRDATTHVTATTVPTYEERPAPTGRDYNDVMSKAQELYDKERTS